MPRGMAILASTPSPDSSPNSQLDSPPQLRRGFRGWCAHEKHWLIPPRPPAIPPHLKRGIWVRHLDFPPRLRWRSRARRPALPAFIPGCLVSNMARTFGTVGNGGTEGTSYFTLTFKGMGGGSTLERQIAPNVCNFSTSGGDTFYALTGHCWRGRPSGCVLSCRVVRWWPGPKLIVEIPDQSQTAERLTVGRPLNKAESVEKRVPFRTVEDGASTGADLQLLILGKKQWRYPHGS